MEPIASLNACKRFFVANPVISPINFFLSISSRWESRCWLHQLPVTQNSKTQYLRRRSCYVCPKLVLPQGIEETFSILPWHILYNQSSLSPFLRYQFRFCPVYDPRGRWSSKSWCDTCVEMFLDLFWWHSSVSLSNLWPGDNRNVLDPLLLQLPPKLRQ